ncbi:MAG: diphthamide synthesis protein, partial [Candidatus Aenigmarchaeota archaeon]|nr:diphthamide synthesis protein [Candidatus Aenigmarchaeota archaeon]
KADEIATAIEKNGTEAVISASPTYGACDLADKEAKQTDCDLLLHIGHSKFYVDFETQVPVIYYPWEYDVELKNTDFAAIKEKRIGLVTTINHMGVLAKVSALLKKSGKEPLIGGQILGCWFANATKIEDMVDAFLFVGSGRFHPLGIKTALPYSYRRKKGSKTCLALRKS